MMKVSSPAIPRTRELFWEPVSNRRWGAYISAIEQQMIDLAVSWSESPSTSLDIGAEGGRWSRVLAEKGWKTICTDIRKEALEICKQRIPSADCILVEKDSTSLPCDTESIGLLLAIEVHELVEQEWFVMEAKRTLMNNGLFVGVFQNRRSWRACLRNLKRDPSDSFRHYTAAYAPWRRLAMKHGLSMVKETGICWMPFGRMSDSRLIPMAVELERWLGLRRLPSLSPWIVFIAQKN